jgi:hypothetical protein
MIEDVAFGIAIMLGTLSRSSGAALRHIKLVMRLLFHHSLQAHPLP